MYNFCWRKILTYLGKSLKDPTSCFLCYMLTGGKKGPHFSLVPCAGIKRTFKWPLISSPLRTHAHFCFLTRLPSSSFLTLTGALVSCLSWGFPTDEYHLRTVSLLCFLCILWYTLTSQTLRYMTDTFPPPLFLLAGLMGKDLCNSVNEWAERWK